MDLSPGQLSTAVAEPSGHPVDPNRYAASAAPSEPQTLGQLLRRFRQRETLSCATAGRRVGVTASAWSGWESGTVPSPGNLRHLAGLLDLTLSEIRALSGPDRVRRNIPGGELAADLTELRFAAGLSSSDLARRMHVSLSLVSRWESGDRVPSEQYWPGLAKALGVETDVPQRLFGAARAPSDVTSSLSLRLLRVRAQVTQAQLAAHVGVDVSSIQRWEATGRISHARARDVARALGIAVEALAADPGQPVRAAKAVPTLRRIRQRRHLPARLVAAQLGVTRSALWAWERGDTRPSWSHARALASILGLPAHEVFSILGLHAPTVISRRDWRASDLPSLLRELRSWNDLTQEHLAGVLAVRPATIRAWEHGRRLPRGRTMQQLDELFRTRGFTAMTAAAS